MPLSPVRHGPEDVLDRRTRLELAAGEVGGHDREAEIVLQPGAPFRRRPCRSWPWHSQHFALCHTSLPRASICCDGAGGSPMYKRRARRLLDEERIGLRRIGAVDRQLVLDVLDDREPIVERQLVPGRHRRAAHAAGDRAQQVAVGRQRLLGQPELEDGRCEVARPLLDT